MAVKVKDVGRAAEKWSRRAGVAGDDYAQGVAETAPQEWEQAARAAETTWQQAVQQAAAQKRYGRGVSGAGDKWQRKSREVGAPRFTQGVAVATDEYAAGVAPYLETIRGLTLPARGPAGDPRNIERVAAIARALRQRKVGGS